jgi:Ni,Fe-hydrogenase III small subunit
MTNFPNPEFPISSADCAEIEAIFIELMRVWVGAAPAEPVKAAVPFVDPPNNARDLRSQWGLQ